MALYFTIGHPSARVCVRGSVRAESFSDVACKLEVDGKSPTSTCSLPSDGSPYSITERRVPELIPVLCSQPAGDVSHKPGGRLPLLSAGPPVTPATLKRAATSFAAR